MDNLREEIAIRLIEERGRLGFSKANLAHLAGLSAEQLRLYELGRNGISAEFLARTAELGFDVQYIICGKRARPMKEGEETMAESVRNKVEGNVQNSVLAGDGATVTQINTPKHITKVKAQIIPGENGISSEQALVLQNKVKEVAEWESRVKQSPKTVRAIWSALNHYCGVATYREIKPEDFDKAYKYLSKWLGRLGNTATARAPVNNETWRKTRYKAIHTKIKQKNIEEWYREMLKSKYGVSSTTELNDENLQKSYLSVSRKK